jgi:hypothetical protein
MSKFRVLCLHGYRQNGDKLRGRMAALRRAFKSSIEFGGSLRGVHHVCSELAD